MMICASFRVENISPIGRSSLKRAVKIPQYPVSHGDPGSIQAVFASTAFDPVSNCLSNELRTVVWPGTGGTPTQDEQVCRHSYDICRAEPTLDPDCQTFAAVLIQNVQRPEDLPVVGSVMEEILRPDAVAVLWPQPHA